MDDRLTDPLDYAADLSQKIADAEVSAIRAAAASIPVGAQGDCEDCGYWSSRLIGGICAPCRDRQERLGSFKR